MEAGHRVSVAVFDWAEPARQVLALRDAGATLVPIPLRSRAFDFLRKHAWIGRLGAPDIVCISQGQEYDLAGRRWGPAMIRWLQRSGTPCVSVVQYNDDNARPSRRGARHARQFLAMTRANLYVARRNIEQTERRMGMGVPHAAVVRNPVNLADTSAIAWPGGDGPARFACVGRLHMATKGQDVLFAALARPAWRDRDWTLSLYGIGPDEACLRQLAEQMRLADRIVFKGQTSDIRGVWAENQVLIMGSRGEGTPLAMVEAMLLGRPCVVTDVGDCAAWVREGTEGWVAGKPSADDLDAALERAWAGRGTWAERGASAGARTRGLFDPDAGGTLLRLLTEHARRS
jgi:glycosyltransferase involved in cell wall biosynthesis